MVNMLRSSTIWESAGRPLFVRSVWLESSSARVGHQRHFILDYEPRTQQERALKSANSAAHVYGRRVSLEPSLCSDSSFWSAANDVLECSERLPLIGSAKLKLHPPTTPQQIKLQQKLHRQYRRPTCSPKKAHNLYAYHGRRLNELHELLSRHSSLQDFPSYLSNACANSDERLAERVLNWLDLAGKSDFVIAQEQASELMQRNRQKSQRAQLATNATPPPQRNATRVTAARTHAQRKRSTQTKCAANSPTHASRCKLRDTVKHISIIFNREGVPVRLNRPARNIDICAMASSANTTRRLAGALASARLYQSAECAAVSVAASGSNKRTPRAVQNNVARTVAASECREEPLTSMLQKRLHEEVPCHDAKRQLHIFMPSLPKKGFLAAELLGNGSTLGGEDSASLLSNTFSELCQM